MELLGEFESDEDEAEQVDNLISKELMELSFDSRTALEEEIHGVHCMALEETPELLRVSLRRLEAILECDKTIPQKEKEAYIRSNSMPMTYIHTNDFKLRFLRLTLFDVTQAAKQIVRFLDVACFLFGEILLERPIRLSDFSKKEQQYIRNGYLQFLPFRDRSGRRVFAVINPPTCGTPFNEMFEGLSISERRKGSLLTIGKLFFYMTWVAGEDVDTQRKGLVLVVWFDPSFKVFSTNRLRNFAKVPRGPNDLTSVRVAAIHTCVPDTTIHRLCVAAIRLRIRNPLRLRMKVCYGESVELMYQLQSYGIPTNHIPLSFSGTIKTGYMKQWTRAREAKESSTYPELANDYRKVIECPQLTDVLFRQGISLIWNPGNASIQNVIENMHKQQKETGSSRLKRREMVLDIIDEVGQTSRFLAWNEGGWWNEIFDREQLILKIEYLIKEVRRSKRQGRRLLQQQLNSSTSIFRGNVDEHWNYGSC